MQVEDAGYRVEQLALVGLEQLVTGKRVEDVEQSLAVMTRRRHSGTLDDPADLEPQKRNRAATPAVGKGREEAEENANASDLAICTKPPYSDSVHMRGSVDCRSAIRFGDDQEFAAADEILNVGR